MGERYYVERQTVHVPGLGYVDGVEMVMMRSDGKITKVVAGRSLAQANAICEALNKAYSDGLDDGLAVAKLNMERGNES